MDKVLSLIIILSHQNKKKHLSLGQDMDYWSVKRKLKIPKLGFGTWQIKGTQCVKAVKKSSRGWLPPY